MPSRGPKVNLKQATLSGEMSSCCATAEAHLTGPSARRRLTFKTAQKVLFIEMARDGNRREVTSQLQRRRCKQRQAGSENDLRSLTSESLTLSLS